VNASVRAAALRASAPLTLMALIFFLSAQPDLSSGLGVWDLIGRKLLHVTEYGSLTLLWVWALAPVIERPMWPAAAIALIYAISDEYHQGFIHGREGTPVDVVVDSIGISIAVIALRYDARFRSALRYPPQRR
jgi:VanZ family protein